MNVAPYMRPVSVWRRTRSMFLSLSLAMKSSLPEDSAIASETACLVGRMSILSFALSILPSIAVRLANLPRRDALNGDAIVLPLSSVAK